MAIPADQQARIRALDTQQSFAVSAPAGSGKTGLLTQRLLCLLAEVDMPEQILCMTFTRKAAAEMRRRLVDALVRAQDDIEPDDAYELQTWHMARRALARDKAQRWNLIKAPNRLRILTIDSFCRHLASQLALESGFGELPEPLENPDRVYQLAIHDVLGELESATPLGHALADLLCHLDNDIPRLESLLMSLLGKREQWLPHIFVSRDARHELELALQTLIDETLRDVSQQLAPQGSDIALLVDYAARHLQDGSGHPLTHGLGMAALPPQHADALQPWLAIVELVLTKTNGWRKTINKTNGFPTKKDSLDPDIADARKHAWQSLMAWCMDQPGLLETLTDIRYLPAPRFDADQWLILEALSTVLPQLAARLSWIFRVQGVSDFTEITLAALAALGSDDNPTDLTLRLDAQIRHILVDEFQDTASVQFTILRRLTAGWQNGDGRTLFFVGDGMQSLYGFRNANVGLFLDIRQHPLGELELAALDLNVNFRSQANIIEWINRLFSGAFPALINTGRGAVPYAASAPFKTPSPGAAVTVDVFTEDPYRLLEARQVAARVAEARVDRPTASIAILVRGRAHLLEIVPALREQNIHWQATDIEPLSTSMPVIDLTSLTRALLNPADRIAWLSILRAPWCGLSLDDLLHLATTQLPDNPVPKGEHYPLLLLQIFQFQQCPSLSDSGRQILTRMTATLRSAWQQRYRKPLRVWLEGLWIDLGGAAALSDESSLAQCRQYWDLLESHTRDACTVADWTDFMTAVDRLYASPAPLTDGPAVQIMTIHKAKGLEFDTVIIPGLDRGSKADQMQLLQWRERVSATGKTQLLMSPPQKLGGTEDRLYEHLRREQTLKSRLENTRVLYVACTRAIERLHLLFRESDREPASNSLLASLWPTLKLELDNPGVNCRVTRHPGQSTDNVQPVTNNTAIDIYQLRLPATWRQPGSGSVDPLPASVSTSPAGLPEGPHEDPQGSGDNQIPPGGKQQNSPGGDARKTGILFHRTLQRLAIDGVEHWHAARVQQQSLVWHRQLSAQGLEDCDKAIASMSNALKNCLEDSLNRWLFDPRLDDSACELALGYVDQLGRPRTAVIDRTFILNNERWIIDYKLAAPERMQSRDDFIIGQIQQYTPQLSLYASLFAKISTARIKTALYFPLLPHLEIIEIK